MSHYLIAILAFILAILLIILIHELGHFSVARYFKIRVKRLSIGFGKPLKIWHDKQGTEYVLTYFPLGGYVKMEDEREGNVAEENLPFAFNRQALWKKMLVVLAGPASNFIFAIFIYWLVFSIGLTLPKPIIGSVLPASIAAKAGLTANMQITNIAGHSTNNWQDVLFTIFPYYKDKETLTLHVTNLTTKKRQVVTLAVAQWRINPVRPKLLQGLGIMPWQPTIRPEVYRLAKHSHAARAGLKQGDVIIRANDRLITSWQQWITLLRQAPKTIQHIEILREGRLLAISFQPEIKQPLWGPRYIHLGIQPPSPKWPQDKLSTTRYDVFTAGLQALNLTWVVSAFNLDIVGKLIVGKLSLKVLSGPISLFKTMELATAHGFIMFLMLMALLSISLGLVNLVPIPGLDGGHACLLLIEAITGKALPAAAQMLIYRLGLIAIFILIAQTIANDLIRV